MDAPTLVLIGMALFTLFLASRLIRRLPSRRRPTETERSGPSVDVVADAARPGLPYRRKEFLFSRPERAFYDALRVAVGEAYHIFPKVRLADLLDVQAGGKEFMTHFNRISAKHADFVLCHPDRVKPLLIIELDDLSHERPDRQMRDAFVDQAVRAAGVPIVHVRTAHAYDPANVAALIGREIGFGSVTSPKTATSASGAKCGESYN